MPACENFNHDITFAKSQKLLVNFPVEDNGKCDVYINDLITCAVDIKNNLEWVFWHHLWRFTKFPIQKKVTHILK